MSQGNRFSVAVHAMALALIGDDQNWETPATSEAIAAHIGGHPVHVRRVLGRLRDAGIVVSHPGRGGGWKLSRPPEEITLKEIYLAVGCDQTVRSISEPGHCPIGTGMVQALQHRVDDAETAFSEQLGAVTLADVLQDANRQPVELSASAND